LHVSVADRAAAIEPKDLPSPKWTSEVKSAEEKSGHIMISYNWGNQEILLKVGEFFSKLYKRSF